MIIEISKNFISGIVDLIKNKSKIKLFGFILAIFISLTGFFYTDKYTLERTFSVTAPLLSYIFFLGSHNLYKKGQYEKEIEQEIIKNAMLFENIGFKSKNGDTPLILDYNENDMKGQYVIESTIPLSTWKKNKEQLEVAFNKIIYKIAQHPESKQMVLINTLPAKYKLDTFIKWSDKYINPDGFNLVLGKSIDVITTDLEIDNHLLIGGSSNIGKSVVICCLVYQSILKGAKIYLLDFKHGVEFNKLFEKFGEVVMKRKRALEVLEGLTTECEKRLLLFRKYGVKKLSEYNKLTDVKKIARIVVFCDEVAELLDKTAKDKEEIKLCNAIAAEFSTLSRLGRASGIHLVCAMQKADADILKGQIKSNMQRLCGALKDSYAVKQFLGVEYTVDNFIPGRFLYRPEGEIVSFQSFYFDSDELKKIKNYKPDGIVLFEQKEKPKLELVKDEPVDEDVETDEKNSKLQGFK